MNRTVLVLLLSIICFYGWGQDKGELYRDNPGQALQDAKTSFEIGNYDKTVSLINIYQALTGNSEGSILLSNAKKCKDLIHQAQSFVNQGDFDSAAQCCRDILELNPKDQMAQGILADAHSIVLIDGHEYVDLGLSVLWAKCNLGATDSSDGGDFYAWGETIPKTSFYWSNYKWCKGDSYSITKYNSRSSDGVIDNVSQLKPVDDAASIAWGASWRMPTCDELVELRMNCEWESTFVNGILGYIGKSRINGNSIFLPATGWYWSNDSAYHKDSSFEINVSLYWGSTLHNTGYVNGLWIGGGEPRIELINRACGGQIRAVTKGKKKTAAAASQTVVIKKTYTRNH